jgi:hypothetical protein
MVSSNASEIWVGMHSHSRWTEVLKDGTRGKDRLISTVPLKFHCGESGVLSPKLERPSRWNSPVRERDDCVLTLAIGEGSGRKGFCDTPAHPGAKEIYQ